MDPLTTVDCEMPSQTETEDTDNGDAIVNSSSSDLNTTTDDSTCASNTSCDPDQTTTHKHRKFDGDINPVEKSVDLTDVTELSNLEDFSAAERKNSDVNKLEDIEKEIPKFDFSGEWYNQKCFQRYWTHYHSAMAWCQKHYKTYNELQQKYDRGCDVKHTTRGEDLQRTQPGCASHWQHPYSCTARPGPFSGRQPDHHPTLNGSPGQSKRRHRRRRRKTQSQSSGSHKCSDTSTQTSEREEFEMEITPEMMEFFMKSQKHKEQRDELKRAQDNTEEERERINVEDVRGVGERMPTVEPPKRRPGSKRTEEMKVLYGKGAAMIHGMETALQMTFDRNTDIKQPKLWPNMPLKISFA